MDITHFEGRNYLSLTDCGPSRFAVWRHLRRQDSATVIQQLEAVFFEHGAPSELLTNNDTAFCSRALSSSWRDGALKSTSDVPMLLPEMA